MKKFYTLLISCLIVLSFSSQLFASAAAADYQVSLPQIVSGFLSFRDKGLNDDQFIAASKHIRADQISGIKVLDVSNNKLGKNAWIALSRFLHHGLAEINLFNNNINDHAMEQLADILPESLTWINIAHNRFGNAGIKALTKRLQQRAMPGLKVLDISYNSKWQFRKWVIRDLKAQLPVNTELYLKKTYDEDYMQSFVPAIRPNNYGNLIAYSSAFVLCVWFCMEIFPTSSSQYVSSDIQRDYIDETQWIASQQHPRWPGHMRY